MKFIKCFTILILLFITSIFAIEPAKVNLEPLSKLVGDEILPITSYIPYLGGRQSPGDQIGTTAYDWQADGNYGQRIMVDSLGQAHIDWMKMNAAASQRYCAWNARYTDGSYFGESPASVSWSGYVQIDVTRDTNPSDQRSVVCYHYNPGAGYYSWIDIDGGNLWGVWPNDPKTPGIAGYIWPKLTVASNNNILLSTGDYGAGPFDEIHLFLTTDLGNNWTLIADIDSCSNGSHFVRASRNPGSHKVVFVYTLFITDTTAAGQLDQDIWYMLSQDDGVIWTLPINITNYQPTDTVRAYWDVHANFDASDNLHVVWGGRKVDSANYYKASKIFHWDEVSDTITVVSSPSIYYNEPGGWWIAPVGHPGAWRLPADQPQLIVDRTNGWLYCLWHGNDDYADTSAAGFFNGEFYGAYSTDNGITWSDYVNLTNTRSPGAGPGECYDEDYMTANPFIVNDSIWITYVEDKDAGSYPHTEGIMTENPVRCWVFPISLITGIEEKNIVSIKDLFFGATIFSGPLLLPRDKNCKVFDITGRVVMPQHIKPGIYFIQMSGRIVHKVIKVK